MAEPRFSDLAFPGKNDDSLSGLHRHQLALVVRAFVGAEMPPEKRASYRRVAALVARALAARPAELLDCFRSPAVAAPTLCRQGGRRWEGLQARVDEAFDAAPPRLLFEMAIRGLIDGDVVWDHGAPWLSSAAIRARLVAPEDSSGWRFSRGGVAVVGGAGDGAFVRLSSGGLTRGRRAVQGLRTELSHVPLSGGANLALVDANPIVSLEAHPEKSGSVLDLGGHSEDDWRSSLQTALDWISEATPELAREMGTLLREIVPVGYHAERHFSASYKEAIGVVYLTLHPNPLVMAEALIHEYQHNKLNVASYRDPLLENAFTPLYPSPLRPDPRPLWGVLLGAHALLPVARFFRRLEKIGHPVSRTPEFSRRLKELDEKNRAGIATLEAHAAWTAVGKRLWAGLKALV